MFSFGDGSMSAGVLVITIGFRSYPFGIIGVTATTQYILLLEHLLSFSVSIGIVQMLRSVGLLVSFIGDV